MSRGYQPGYYEGSIVDQAIVKASTGNAQLLLLIQPITWSSFDGQVNDEPVGNDSTRRVYMTITDKTKERIVKTLRAIGFGGSSISDVETKKDEGHSRLIGVQAKFVMKIEEWKGRECEQWNLVTPRENNTESSGMKLDDKEMLELDTLCASDMAETAGTAKVILNPVPASQLGAVGPLDAGPDSDDEPF